MNTTEIISLCGDICSECPRYIATQANDYARLKEIATLWFRLGFRSEIVSEEEIKCYGCSKTKPCSYNINTCEHIRDLNNCGECKFYLCAKMQFVFEKTDKVDEVCKINCTPDEYIQMKKAFLSKREILDKINKGLMFKT
jgi:hypothetical protein